MVLFFVMMVCFFFIDLLKDLSVMVFIIVENVFVVENVCEDFLFNVLEIGNLLSWLVMVGMYIFKV